MCVCERVRVCVCVGVGVCGGVWGCVGGGVGIWAKLNNECPFPQFCYRLFRCPFKRNMQPEILLQLALA